MYHQYQSPSKARSERCMPVWLIALISVLAVAGVTVLVLCLCGCFKSKPTKQKKQSTTSSKHSNWSLTEGEQSQQAIQYGSQQHDRPIDRITTADQVPAGTQTVGTKSVPGSETQPRKSSSRPQSRKSSSNTQSWKSSSKAQSRTSISKSQSWEWNSKTQSWELKKTGCCSYMSKFWSWTRWGLGWAFYPFSFCCGRNSDSTFDSYDESGWVITHGRPVTPTPSVVTPPAPVTRQCPKCHGMGGWSSFGKPCRRMNANYKCPCLCCNGQGRTTKTNRCNLCRGKGGVDTWSRPCEPHSIHYEHNCFACSGAGYSA